MAQHRRQQGARRHRPGGDLIKTVGAILARAAVQEILPRFQALTADQVRQKTSAFDIVTEADEAAEAVIAADLREAFPGALIVGEEGTERDPSLLQAIGGAELAFVVDPIDGTKNFASGLPLFGVMAAATVMRLQTIVSREVGGTETAVVTVGALHAGTKANIIPDSCRVKLAATSIN